MSELAKKIRVLRQSMGLNQSEFADMFGVGQGTVSRWEKGSMPEPPALTKIAELADEDIKSLLGGDVSPSNSGPRLMVRGAVAAGVWQESYEWPQEDWIPYTGGTHVAADTSRRFGLVVEGESMNEVYPPGTILDCLSAFDTDTPKSGQRVVVVRHRDGDGYEATVKEFLVDKSGECWLVPRSYNPAFQAPIKLDEGDPDIETRIIAKVVGSYRPE